MFDDVFYNVIVCDIETYILALNFHGASIKIDDQLIDGTLRSGWPALWLGLDKPG